MARFLLLLALVLSLAFAGTALATEDDDLYDDGADICAIDDVGDDDGDLLDDDEDLQAEDDFGDEEDFDDEEYFGDDEEAFEDDLFRASTATADGDDAADEDFDDGDGDDADADDCEPVTDTPDLATAQRKPHGTKGDDRLVGGDGRDRLFGRRGNDFLDGRGAADYLNGGPDDDEIVTGRAPTGHKAKGSGKRKAKGDRVVGAGGADLIRARNGARDRIDCGRGRDTVYADAGDRVRKNCETVKYR